MIFFFSQVIKGSEILEVLHSLPRVREFLFSLYDCHYATFFKVLGKTTFEFFLSALNNNLFFFFYLINIFSFLKILLLYLGGISSRKTIVPKVEINKFTASKHHLVKMWKQISFCFMITLYVFEMVL